MSDEATEMRHPQPASSHCVLGRTHAVVGVAAYGTAVIGAGHLGVRFGAAQLVAGTAGSALARDLDEAGSTPGAPWGCGLGRSSGPPGPARAPAMLAVGVTAAICAHLVTASAALAALRATTGRCWKRAGATGTVA